MLFFITGASGAGKSTCLAALREAHPTIRWLDFDSVGVPDPCPFDWRAKTTEHWINIALGNQREDSGAGHTAIVGGAIPGEILAAPSAPLIKGGVRLLLLDCHDLVRIDRLRARGHGGDTQEMLSWAAWQRMHAVDPQWSIHTIRNERSWAALEWKRWDTWQRGDPRWDVSILENTSLTISQTVAALVEWLGPASAPARRTWPTRPSAASRAAGSASGSPAGSSPPKPAGLDPCSHHALASDAGRRS